MDTIMEDSSEKQPKETFYDDIYFDTDQEDESDWQSDPDDPSPGIGLLGMKKAIPKTTTTRPKIPKKQQRKIMTDEDLMYDPDLDDADEEWVAEKIKKAAPKDKTPEQATTDAILTCPMCFNPLCYSCQRHDLYPNQFRAMFVENCKVVKTERYRTKPVDKKRQKKGKNSKDISSSSAAADDDGDDGDDSSFFVVRCETCDTHVAMMDNDEVYHFFNAISN
ncbi:E2F-associated phosphoprotein-domain-containing protein [Phycomyces blakesleeanus]|uniref:E2F-associated phosphoprotein n=2 Tax=Phycomyces blakesleeanus TaxID=4837 RepID=A0A167PCN2_PHYB8|nr:hypothetical protein PHYBLDRAFT_157817 [Phycomyces blakesleeanus NRRL 1555(-)]OAD77674.1 hypothetical protein PHYBLDRAFT_157817 [Phycomyces blakesleeanus NRRL 1555(-)]|eukprot:XP_018295714.1 hypothetical protein PHYBLDRAFT_157817 [Phycomyces blakesleeanus NRRL 1555(-)]